MARAKKSHQTTLHNLTPSKYLVIALDTVRELGWELDSISETGLTARVGWSMRSRAEYVTIAIEGNDVTLTSECTGFQMVDWGKNQANIDEYLEKFNELKHAYNSSDLLDAAHELQQAFIERANNPASDEANNGKFVVADVLFPFIPKEGYFITPIVINLNIALFIAMILTGVSIIQPDNESLLRWGADFGPRTLDGEWWRLLSCCFLHIGVIHLLMNMYAFLYIGSLLEPLLGRGRMLTSYLVAGVISSVTSLWWHNDTISAGASGAIFGMYGVFLALLSTDLIAKEKRRALISSVIIFVGYNLLYGMKAGIDNAAHIGGLVSGALIGFAYIPSLKNTNTPSLQNTTSGVISLVAVVGCFLVIRSLPNDIGEYDRRYPEFAILEKTALEVYSMPEGTPDDSLLRHIKNKGIPAWQQSITLLDDLQKLDVPERVHERLRKLIVYSDVRLKSFTMMEKALEENTDKYQDSLEIYNQEIRDIIESLKTKKTQKTD